MAQVFCSIGTVLGKANGNNYRLLERYANQIKCDGFEFMMCSSWQDKVGDIVDFVRRINLNVPIYHCRKHIGENIGYGGEDGFSEAFHEFESNCKMAHLLGAEKVVLHLWSGRVSDQHFENNIAAYPRLKEIADANQVDLLIENVVCNAGNPMDRLSELAEIYPDIHFVFDTKMAEFHGQLELLYDSKYEWLWKEGYIRHYHVNDYCGGILDWANLKTLPIGYGQIDFERFFDFINDTKYNSTFTLEAPVYDQTGTANIELLNRQIEFILKRVGN